MILLSDVVGAFEGKLKNQYANRLLPGHHRALSAMKRCRTESSRQMLACCSECNHKTLIPHSCGHRLCSHCQHHESQRWLDSQHKRLVPAEYFLVTFTLPRQLRSLAFRHQKIVYDALMSCAWQTLNQFSGNDKELRGRAGAIAVLHTHSRRLDYHPHVHIVMPAAAISRRDRHWRTRRKAGYLFSSKALARVFRGKFLSRLKDQQLKIPSAPAQWVVDCQAVGQGVKAITYLGKYLYRGVLQEKNIVSMDADYVTYRYTENTGRVRTRTIKGEDFLWLLIQHTLPKGFRRARNYGFFHPNSKRLIQVLQIILLRSGLVIPQQKTKRSPIVCSGCGSEMVIMALGLSLMQARNETEPARMAMKSVM